MQRYHDPSTDPLSTTVAERERQRIAQATEVFLAKGGRVDQIGNQMKGELLPFVINAAKSPVYAHLYARPEAERSRSKPLAKPIIVLAKSELEVEQLPSSSVEQQITPEMTPAQLAARLMVQAVLGASPRAASEAIGVTEKQARQVARDYHITFKRQR